MNYIYLILYIIIILLSTLILSFLYDEYQKNKQKNNILEEGFKNNTNEKLLKYINIIKKGSKKFASKIKTTFKEETSMKFTKNNFNPNRYLVIFDTENTITQKILKDNLYLLNEYFNVDTELVNFVRNKLNKIQCCELIYSIDIDKISEKIYICSERTRNIYSMEKTSKNKISTRLYKSIFDFNNKYEKLLMEMTPESKNYIKWLKPENWADFAYQRWDDDIITGYNIILDKKYTVESYNNNFIELGKSLIKNNSSSNKHLNKLKKWLNIHKNKTISWIAVLLDGGFTIYIR